MHWMDPAYLPETKGTVDRFLLGPHGEADGLLLTDGLEVHFPPHLSARVLQTFQSGAAVTVRGVRPRGAEVLAAVSLTAANGTVILDEGSPKHDPARLRPTPATGEPADIQGTFSRLLHGPKGEVRGALLDDGGIVRFPAQAVASFIHLLAPGHALAARGDGIANALGRVVVAKQIGPSLTTLEPIAPRPPAKQPQMAH